MSVIETVVEVPDNVVVDNKVIPLPPAAAAHLSPVASALSAVNKYPLVPAANLLKVSAPVPTTKSPLASIAVAIELVIVTVPITQKVPQIGDVIAYQAKRFNGENVAVFSHRIIGGDIDNGFIVKGDANKSPDPQKPKAEDILGVVFFVIPFIGNLLTPKALFLLVPSFFGLWLIMDAMRNVE